MIETTMLLKNILKTCRALVLSLVTKLFKLSYSHIYFVFITYTYKSIEAKFVHIIRNAQPSDLRIAYNFNSLVCSPHALTVSLEHNKNVCDVHTRHNYL